MGEQIYNPSAGVNRMFQDIENFVNPIVFDLHPLFKVTSVANVYIVAAIFLVLLIYMVFIRKHTVLGKLKNPRNYFWAGALLLIYAFLTEAPLNLVAGIKLNFGLIILPMAARLFGPILAGAFGIIQYGTSFLMHPGEAFNLSSMLIAAISGMIYGRFFYMKANTYMRSFWAKLLVNVLCNIILVPFVTGDVMSEALADSITQNVVTNIVLVPLQALAIFVGLFILEKIKQVISDSRWGIGKK